MSDIKNMLTDLPTSIRLKELGVEQTALFSWKRNSDLDIELFSADEYDIENDIVRNPTSYSAFTLSEVLELIDWSKHSIAAPVNDNMWWVMGMQEDFTGTTLLEAATKALIHQLENK